MKFRKNIERFQSNGADTNFILIISMGHKSVNIVHDVTVLIICTISDHGLQLY